MATRRADPNQTDADVEAAFGRGDLLRTNVLRQTWYFVTPMDIRWLLRLTRPRVHALLERATVVDGITVGSWKRALPRNAVRVEARLFGPLTNAQAAALDAAVRRFGRFLGLSSTLVLRRPRPESGELTSRLAS